MQSLSRFALKSESRNGVASGVGKYPGAMVALVVLSVDRLLKSSSGVGPYIELISIGVEYM
jgi:hypothetical protein